MIIFCSAGIVPGRVQWWRLEVEIEMYCTMLDSHSPQVLIPFQVLLTNPPYYAVKQIVMKVCDVSSGMVEENVSKRNCCSVVANRYCRSLRV